MDETRWRTHRLELDDQTLREWDGTVLAADAEGIVLDRSAFYPGGGGQPHDTGALVTGDVSLPVTRVGRDGGRIWHGVDGAPPVLGAAVLARLDWERRYTLMRVHTAMHALCAVMWNRYRCAVTGSDMKVGEGRLDVELPDWDPAERERIEEELNRELARDLPVRVSFLPREEADRDPSLIRTKVSLLPPSLRTVRIVDIAGLDRQADGGTHVRSTGEVGLVSLTKVETKGRSFRRLRIALAGAVSPLG